MRQPIPHKSPPPSTHQAGEREVNAQAQWDEQTQQSYPDVVTAADSAVFGGVVRIDVRADGRDELIALDDGHRESTESGPTCSARPSDATWPRRCSRSVTARSGSGPRSATCSCRPANSAAGSSKIANVLNALPKSAHPSAEGRDRGDLERRGPRARTHGPPVS